MTHESPVAHARRLERAGDVPGALAFLQARLRGSGGGMRPDEVLSAGKAVTRLLAAGAGGQAQQTVMVLGQCTTSWLTYAITASALEMGVHCAVTDGPYDNVLQSLVDLSPDECPEVLVLLPWHQRLLGGAAIEVDQRLAYELAYWRQVWQVAKEKGVRRLIQVGFDWNVPGAAGYHLANAHGGDIDLVRRVNAALRDALPGGSYFVPLDDISGTLGRQHFYDLRGLYWTRQPFSEAGLVQLSRHIAAGLRALTTGPCKVLVLDLDNTLWGGVVGETGPLGIELGDSPQGEAFRAFQHHVKALSQRGVLLAVCSKNNEADAKEPFRQHPDMVLQLSDFASFVAQWEPKPEGLRRIADELRLGLDSFVFFDDNPFEREMVRQALPQVQVVEVPTEPADYVGALQAGLWFEASALTGEDIQRTRLYHAEALRRDAEADAGNVDDYLSALSMKAMLRPVDEGDLPRVVQLLAKTNQFNLTTRRHTADDVRGLLAVPGSLGFSLRLHDRFVDHGLVAVVLASPDAGADLPTLVVDSLLMSCRVIGRTVEAFLIQALAQRAFEMGYARLVGTYRATAKNQLVEPFYGQMGFERCADAAAGDAMHVLPLPASRLPKTFVEGQA